jgi:putative transcriptional regulator
MKPKMFEELLESVREGGAILRGQTKPSRRFEVGSSGIRAIREPDRQLRRLRSSGTIHGWR